VDARLVIARDSPKDIKIRGLFVFVDGKEVANIAYGDKFEMSLAPGQHTLKVTNKLYAKNEDLDLKEGEVAEYTAANVLSGLWAVIIGWSGMAPYKVVLKRAQ
jgi:hypothetical protein